MSFLVRMINRAKWEPPVNSGIPADAITNDLKTSSNTLSFWKCDKPKINSEIELQDVALALAAGRPKLDRLGLIYIEETAFSKMSLPLHQTPGNTPVDSLRNSHFDLVDLDFVRLGKVAYLIHGGLSDSHALFSKAQVKEIIKDAISKGLLRKDSLSADLANDIT